MRNFLKAFLFFLIFAAIAQYFYTNNTKLKNEEINNNSIISSKKEFSTPNNNIQKPDSLLIDSAKHNLQKNKETLNLKEQVLNFKHKFITKSDNFRVIFPRNFNYFKDSIFSFLNNNQEKEITIIAKHLSSEKLSNGSNYGTERAAYLKNKLIKYGVNPKKINIKSIVENYTYDNNGFYADGILITYNNLSAEKLKNIENEVTNKTLYSYFGNKNFKPDGTLYSYLLEVKNYLKKNPKKQVTIIGHTDNVGNAEANNWIGMQRAKNLALYFNKQGIDSTKITVLSKGQTHPIDDNTTKEGRANNRRIEIQIK